MLYLFIKIAIVLEYLQEVQMEGLQEHQASEELQMFFQRLLLVKADLKTVYDDMHDPNNAQIPYDYRIERAFIELDKIMKEKTHDE